MLQRISKSCLLCFLLFAGLVENCFALEQLDSVIASVDGEPITSSEFSDYVKRQAVFSSAASQASPKRMLRDFVMLKVLDREAEAVGATVGETEVSTYLKEVIRQNQTTQQEFQQVLAARGVSWPAYLEQVRNDILKSRVVSARVRSKIAVMDEDIQRRLEADPSLVSSTSKVWLLQRVFPAENFASSDEARMAAEAFIKGLNPFNERERRSTFLAAFPAKLASDLGEISTSDLREEISEGIADVPSGESSPPVQLGADFAVFMVLGRSEAGHLGAASKEVVREQIFQEKFEAGMRRFLEEDLPRRYHIEFVN